MAKRPEKGPKSRRYFTVASANKMLPLVRSIVTDIVERFGELSDLRNRLEILQGSRREALSGLHREEVEEVEHDFERKKEELQTLVEELKGLGVELKGPDGLVDFPAMMDDREVCLCWKMGEPEVMFWHEVDAGFAGRQHLPAEMIVARDPDH